MSQDESDKTNFERRQELRDDQEGFRLHQEEHRLQEARRSSTLIWLINTIVWLLGMLQTLLIIRFLLRLFGANPQNSFAQLINNLSAPFMAPFSTLFISPTSAGGANIFDINIVMAIVAYALLSYLAVLLVRFIFLSRNPNF